jgi:hypothetical protein
MNAGGVNAVGVNPGGVNANGVNANGVSGHSGVDDAALGNGATPAVKLGGRPRGRGARRIEIDPRDDPDFQR